jgi:hypothetical protein
MGIDKLIFLDESGINIGMTRLYGRSSSNERVIDYTPDVRFERTSILSSIRANGDMVPLVFEGGVYATIPDSQLRESLKLGGNLTNVCESAQIMMRNSKRTLLN